MVYSGLNESEIKWLGQVRNFDKIGGQFDIKPKNKIKKYTLNLINKLITRLMVKDKFWNLDNCS